jgi:hypothetical protein
MSKDVDCRRDMDFKLMALKHTEESKDCIRAQQFSIVEVSAGGY